MENSMEKEVYDEAKKLFGDFFSDSELEKFTTNINGLSHPVYYLINPYQCSSNNYKGFTNANTQYAFNLIKRNNQGWLDSNKKRLLNIEDRSNSASMLGEIRCFGYLLEAFAQYKVETVKTDSSPTPDFKVSNDTESVIIEVNSPQLNGEQRESLEEFHSSKTTHSKGKNTIREHLTVPFGTQNAKCIAENVICKLAYIKSKEHQLNEKEHNVLWVDLQDEYMNLLGDRADSACPIFTGNGYGVAEAFYSNELWYAMYANKGTPIFEGLSLNDGIPVKELPVMTHNGRFCKEQNSKLSAFVFSFPNATVIYENPYTKPLPKWFIETIQGIRWFRYQGSKLNVPDNILSEQLSIDREIITSLSKKELKRW